MFDIYVLPTQSLFFTIQLLCFQGCWRKIVVDDTMPFDADGKILLPTTTLEHELWPMLLCKALIKLAAIE